jgi:hypothetical protein
MLSSLSEALQYTGSSEFGIYSCTIDSFSSGALSVRYIQAQYERSFTARATPAPGDVMH